MITTRADSAVSNVIGFNNTHLSPCTHEKADYRIILHISEKTRCGCSKIKVVTSNTDVNIICLAYFHLINDLKESWLIFGKGKSKRFITIQTIAEQFGPAKCKALLGFDAITGCDRVSFLWSREKARMGSVE